MMPNMIKSIIKHRQNIIKTLSIIKIYISIVVKHNTTNVVKHSKINKTHTILLNILKHNKNIVEHNLFYQWLSNIVKPMSNII